MDLEKVSERRCIIMEMAQAGLALLCLLGAASAEDPFEPNWDTLLQYQCPDWFRDAKFGIFMHWGPQSVPVADDGWYARHMYVREGAPPSDKTPGTTAPRTKRTTKSSVFHRANARNAT
jgi:hypothetical protein